MLTILKISKSYIEQSKENYNLSQPKQELKKNLTFDGFKSPNIVCRGKNCSVKKYHSRKFFRSLLNFIFLSKILKLTFNGIRQIIWNYFREP
jgi:hypothetical protein